MAWDDLTERQKALDRVIESCGIKLVNSRSCVDKIMKEIGANADEDSFVISRIQLRITTGAILQDADDLIDCTEKMSSDFEEDDKEWERRGKSMGFNFEDK